MLFYSHEPTSQAVSTAALVMIEETQNSNERGDGVTQMCCCSQKPAYIESEHAHLCAAAHNALDPCIDSSTTQSSQLSTNPSIAGWLGSNHHSQKGWNKRMAYCLCRNPLPYYDWWDRSGTGSWGILYCNKHTIKNLWWQTAQEGGLLSYPRVDNAFVAPFFTCQECVFHCKFRFTVQASEAH